MLQNADPIVGAIPPIKILNQRSSQSALVGVYQMPTRSLVLIGTCAMISRPDSTLAGSLQWTCVPRFGGNLCFNWHKLFHAVSLFLLRCFHLSTFKTSFHIISDVKTAFSSIHYLMGGQPLAHRPDPGHEGLASCPPPCSAITLQTPAKKCRCKCTH